MVNLVSARCVCSQILKHTYFKKVIFFIIFDELKCRLAGAEDVVNMMEAAMMMFLMMKLVNGSGTTERMDE